MPFDEAKTADVNGVVLSANVRLADPPNKNKKVKPLVDGVPGTDKIKPVCVKSAVNSVGPSSGERFVSVIVNSMPVPAVSVGLLHVIPPVPEQLIVSP